MIPQETVNRIIDSAKIEEVIGDYVTLKRNGANYIACCPFHNEKTPSFSVTPARGFFYCFGCKKGGDSITFLMEHERMSYIEAIRALAKKYNIEIEEEEETPESRAARQRSESLYIVSDYAQKFFAQQLEQGEGRSVGYAYFKSRGLEDETIRKFGLGWSPRDSKALLLAATAAGYKEDYLVDTGLCIRTEEGRLYDRFHERAVFPLHSVSGRVIGFSARTLKSDKTVAKYVNSPQTEIYDKSRFLYGMWFAKQQIAKEDSCILVEGNLDMISMHQLGLTNVVASCGTSLTVHQIRLIKRFTRNVTIIYDGDSAGIHAALRGIGLVLKEDMNVRIVLLPDGMDPDDFCKSHTLEQVRDFIRDNTKDFIGFKTDLLLADAGDDPMRRADLINDIADTIALMPDPIKRATYTTSCASRLDIAEPILRRRVQSTRTHVEEDERRQTEREALERQRAEAAAAPGNAEQKVEVNYGGAIGVKSVKVPAKPSLMEPVERDLLKFILCNGLDKMDFPLDSPHHSDPPLTVAEFIDGSLDGEKFEEGPRLKVYELYFKYYDEGLEQEEILHRMSACEDRAVVSLLVELTSVRYELTEKNLRNSLTKTQTILVQQVPRAVMLFHIRMLEKQTARCREQLRDPESDKKALLIEIGRLNGMKSKLSAALGRA